MDFLIDSLVSFRNLFTGWSGRADTIDSKGRLPIRQDKIMSRAFFVIPTTAFMPASSYAAEPTRESPLFFGQPIVRNLLQSQLRLVT
jgi:hypothetical protein